MYNGQTISLKEILWKVLNNPIAADLTIEQAGEYTLEFIKLVGAPVTLLDQTTTRTLSSFKCKVPEEMTDIKAVSYMCEGCSSDRSVPMRYASNTHHIGLSGEKSRENFIEDDFIKGTDEYTYIIQNGILFASREKGTIDIIYKAIAIDKEGFPLVPDNIKFKLGLEYYILERYLFPIWSIGKISDKVYNKISQERDWYLGGADTSLKVYSVDHMESIMNSINRIIINDRAYDTFYKKAGKKEIIKRYH